jgi:hypothetical protein
MCTRPKTFWLMVCLIAVVCLGAAPLPPKPKLPHQSAEYQSGFAKRILDRPSSQNSAISHIVRNSESLAHFHKASCNSTESYNFVTSGVSTLLLTGAPFAVSRLVVSRVVYSVNLKSVRTFSHVGKEVLKFLPSLAYRDASRSVILKPLAFWIGASCQHTCPGLVCGCLSESMCAKKISSNFPLKATTGPRCPTSQRRIFNFDFLAAIAQAQTVEFKFAAWQSTRRSFSDNGKSCESETDKGYFCRHTFGFIKCLFNSGRPATTGARCDYYSRIESSNQVVL